MPGPVTDNFEWQLPEVDGDEGTWGDVLNAALAEIDTDLQAVKDTADAALPLAGGTMDGPLNLKTSTIASSHKGPVSGAVTLDLEEAGYFTATITGATAFIFDNVATGEFASGFILMLSNGGSALVTWPAGVQWPLGVVPTLTVDGVDCLVFLTHDDGATWRGFVSGKDIS